MVQNGVLNPHNPRNSRRNFPWHGICTLPARCPKAYPRRRRGVCLENWRKTLDWHSSNENETTPGETMPTTPLTPLRSLFRAVTGRSALLMALATVTFAALSFTPTASFADATSAPAAAAPAAD